MRRTKQRPKLRHEGSIESLSVAEVLRSVDSVAQTGILTASRGSTKARVLTRGGAICGAHSTDPEKRLSALLKSYCSLSSSALEGVLEQHLQSRTPLSVLVLEQGLLSPLEIRELFLHQARLIVWDLLSWTDGELSFEIGENNDYLDAGFQLPIRRTLLEGLRQGEIPQQLLQRLGGKSMVLEAAFHHDEVVDLGLDDREYALLSMADGQQTFEELTLSGPLSEERNAKLLVAFTVLELLVPAQNATRRLRVVTEKDLIVSEVEALFADTAEMEVFKEEDFNEEAPDEEAPDGQVLQEEAADASSPAASFDELFKQAMSCYLERRYPEARTLFDQCLSLRPTDRRVLHNLERISERISD